MDVISITQFLYIQIPILLYYYQVESIVLCVGYMKVAFLYFYTFG